MTTIATPGFPRGIIPSMNTPFLADGSIFGAGVCRSGVPKLDGAQMRGLEVNVARVLALQGSFSQA